MKPNASLRLAALLLLLAPATGVYADAALQERIANVERLLETSSGAQQVRSGGTDAARAAHERALDQLAQAREHVAAGDDEAGRKLLDSATLSMLEAVRLAGAPSGTADKQRRDYDDRERSIAALMEALARIAGEKGEQARAADIERVVGRLLAEAERQKATGDYKTGRRTLDGAYDLAKRGIDDLRSGDTLVRTLNFASKEEEYRYEVDRNDTHRMLIRVLLEEKRGDADKDRLVDGFVHRSQVLRTEAEAQAGKGEFEAAVTTLEAATRELVRAIRSAGVYIPG